MARIVTYNPIIMGLMETKREYLRRLKRYINAGGWNCGKLECAELAACEKIILDSSKIENSYDISFYKDGRRYQTIRSICVGYINRKKETK